MHEQTVLGTGSLSYPSILVCLVTVSLEGWVGDGRSPVESSWQPRAGSACLENAVFTGLG